MSSYAGSLRQLTRTRLTLVPHTRLPVRSHRRTFQSSSQVLARKDAQGKDDLKPESNEYSKSGSDQQAAAMDDAAFNPQKTSPEEEHDTAGQESGAKGVRSSQSKDENNPLNVSPANKDISQAQKSGGGEGSPATSGSGEQERARTSGGGSAPKSGGGKHGGGGGN